MNRIGCSAHMLDKVGRRDALDAMNEEKYAEMHNKVFKKLQVIWDQKDSRLKQARNL